MAHLALNWGWYNGSPSEFDAAASELLAVVRLDVRNRIICRFPLTNPPREKTFAGFSFSEAKIDSHDEQSFHLAAITLGRLKASDVWASKTEAEALDPK